MPPLPVRDADFNWQCTQQHPTAGDSQVLFPFLIFLMVATIELNSS